MNQNSGAQIASQRVQAFAERVQIIRRSLHEVVVGQDATMDLLLTCALTGSHALLVCDGETLTYADAEARSALLAKGLVASGAGKGARIRVAHCGSANRCSNERNIVIEAEGAARGLVRHGDTVVGGVSGPLMWSNASFGGVG